jgi:hypothetical protein
MNERWKKLWSEAAELETDDSWEGQTKFMERFAELIVRECIAQCNDGDSRWFIAQHFGVEE